MFARILCFRDKPKEPVKEEQAEEKEEGQDEDEMDVIMIGEEEDELDDDEEEDELDDDEEVDELDDEEDGIKEPDKDMRGDRVKLLMRGFDGGSKNEMMAQSKGVAAQAKLDSSRSTFVDDEILSPESSTPERQ